jgi:hypothetical protein
LRRREICSVSRYSSSASRSRRNGGKYTERPTPPLLHPLNGGRNRA